MTLAFDVYGTLVDTAGIARALEETAGADSAAVAARWRDKQLEYSFRRALMRRYVSFAECTRQALDFVLAERNLSADESTRKALMKEYGRLPAFPDAEECLKELSAKSGHHRFAFSNGGESAVREVLGNCELLSYFNDVVSVETTKLYKPAPEVYKYFIDRSEESLAFSPPIVSETSDTGKSSTDSRTVWLVSSNPFDIIGARAAGWQAAWINRGNVVFDKWPEKEFQPTVTLNSLKELPKVLS